MRSADLPGVPGRAAVRPAVQVRGLDAQLSQSDPYLRAVLDTMFERVEDEEAFREPEDPPHPGQVDIDVDVERLSDGDELIARAHQHLLEAFETRPGALASELAFVLPPLGPEHECL